MNKNKYNERFALLKGKVKNRNILHCKSYKICDVKLITGKPMNDNTESDIVIKRLIRTDLNPPKCQRLSAETQLKIYHKRQKRNVLIWLFMLSCLVSYLMFL